jgi:hypothetical protein
VWVHDPAGAPWEVYTVKDDNPADGRPATASLPLVAGMNDGGCCTTRPVGESSGHRAEAPVADQQEPCCA